METKGNLLIRARAIIPVVLPLVLGSLIEVEERAIAIEARGFNSNRKETSLVEIPDTISQVVFRKALLIFITVLMVARIAWQLLN
jgi:energy-coupling factor transporter transmembrane protein EcfT